MRWSYLGRVPYQQSLAKQLELRAAILAGEAPDTLLLLEHPPVITLGRSARPENVLVSEAERARRGVDLVEVERGGDVTFHGPGQLVGYPIRRVGRGVKEHVAGMADAIIELLAGAHGIEARWKADQPGVWTRRGKIAAVGVDAREGVAIHGLALNLAPDLSWYQLIVPCGLAGAAVTSIEAINGTAPSLLRTAEELAELLSQRWYGTGGERVSPEDLRR
jgi:lipoyl(octanoyl) transferase